ncbi:hypothetical protein GCM10009821_23260 [Aeromicrobium halocynthiae]|uniref:Peptidase S9 prolyl oligopeptidase catalytic domain-containing protein n=1 Tax=Aeromicrobium halocynthiae TaxID=560557 RepID=A0ABP5HQ22_9ACTN
MTRASAALQRADAVPRPELPLPGFRLVRRAGDEWPVVLDEDHRLLLVPDARVQRVSAGPDGQVLALELAEDGSETGHLVLLDRAGRLTPVATPALRHGDQAWTGSQLHLLDRAGGWHVVDSRSPTPRARLVRAAAAGRPRLVSLGGRCFLAEPGPDQRDPSWLLGVDGRQLLRLPAVRSLSSVGDTALVVSADHLLLLDASDGEPRVKASATLDARTHGVPVHAAAAPGGAAVHLVRAGHSRVVEHDRGLRPLRDHALSADDDVATATGLAWADGAMWVRHESPGGAPCLTRLEDLPTGPRPTGLRSRLVTVTAEDGTPLELVVTGSRSGPVPTLLEVYGGFGLVDVPRFEPSVAAWCDVGGLHVTARVRGGGGHRSPWHEQARGPRKGRAVADTVAVARALVDRGMTSPQQLVVAGASHGGLVAASAALAAPGLLAGAACTAAPLDPHRLAEHPLARAWTEEFGDPGDDAVREAMDDYSPLRRLDRWPRPSPLPRFLLTTFAEDSRVSSSATDRFETALRSRGAEVQRHHRPAMGHGANARSRVHDFATSVLDFALAATGAT